MPAFIRRKMSVVSWVQHMEDGAHPSPISTNLEWQRDFPVVDCPNGIRINDFLHSNQVQQITETVVT